MQNKKSMALGIFLIIASVVFLCIYAWLIFFSKWSILILQISCFMVVVIIMGLIVWVGKTLMLAKKVGEEMEN